MRFLTIETNAASTSAAASSAGYLVTAAKDTLVKLWDLSIQHCLQTIVGHPSEVWTLDLNQEQDLLFTGGGEGELKAWSLDRETLSKGLSEAGAGHVSQIYLPC